MSKGSRLVNFNDRINIPSLRNQRGKPPISNNVVGRNSGLISKTLVGRDGERCPPVLGFRQDDRQLWIVISRVEHPRSRLGPSFEGLSSYENTDPENNQRIPGLKTKGGGEGKVCCHT